MKDYTNNTPIFSETLKITETSDPAHADIINKAPMQLLQNTLCNRQMIEHLQSSAMATEDYDPAVSYQAGMYCLYQNTLYKCVSETAGTWNPDCWQATNTLDEIASLKGLIARQEETIGMIKSGADGVGVTTLFGEGEIKEIYDDGRTRTTVFEGDTIIERYSDPASGKAVETKTTIEEGKIRREVLEYEPE